MSYWELIKLHVRGEQAQQIQNRRINSFLLSAIKANTDLPWLFKHVSSNQRSLRSLCLWFNWINACCRYNISRRQFSEIRRIQTRIDCKRRNRADVDLKHNENEWHEVDGEQWKWILRNSRKSFFDWRLLRVRKFLFAFGCWLKFFWGFLKRIYDRLCD